MAFDGIITKTIVNELSNILLNGRIDKIFMPSKLEIILGIYSSRTNYKLILSSHPTQGRICLTKFNKNNPKKAFNFCMVLRKYLLGAKIASISSPGLERIVEIELENLNELNDRVKFKLILEIMGKHSNIILLNYNNTIIDSIKHVDNSMSSVREVLPAREYVYPHQENRHDFLNTDLENFKKIIETNNNIASNFIGFSIPFVNSILLNFAPSNLDEIYSYIKNLIDCIYSNKYQVKDVLDENGNIKDFCLYPSNTNNTKSDVLNSYLDIFYNNKENFDLFKNLQNKLLKLVLAEINKNAKILTNIYGKLEECKKMDVYNLYAELLTANLYKIKKVTDSITLENYYDNTTVTISLDKRLTPAKCAAMYYKKYNKLKNTKLVVSKQLEIVENSCKYLESITYELNVASSYNDLLEIEQELETEGLISVKSKNKKDIQTEPLKFTINNFSVFVGKNNKQNDVLTLKTAKKHDIWLHASKIHGSHVIIETNNKKVDNNTLVKAACLAAYYSKAKNSSNVGVDYCPVKYVKKPKGAKLGMVIYSNYKTMYVEPKC